MMCRALIDAAVCCACPAMTGWLAIMMCRALIDGAVCCASSAASGELAIMMLCGDGQTLYTAMPRADIRCSVLLLRGSAAAWQLCWVYCLAICCRVLYLRCCARQDGYVHCFTIRTAVPDSLAGYVALIYAAACAAALNGTAMCLALLYAAVPSAGNDASDQLGTMICYTLVYASVCGTGADTAVGLATILCHARKMPFRLGLPRGSQGWMAAKTGFNPCQGSHQLAFQVKMRAHAALLGTRLCTTLQLAVPTLWHPTRSHGILR